MNNRAIVAALAASLTLCACGGAGGGVGSTPPPPPTPPAPPPPPPPPPSSANESLADLQFSESFTNDAVTANGSSAGSAALSVVYDAAAGTYTITNGGRSQSFGSAHRDVGQSNAQVNVYERASGGTMDSLTLTRPGDSGELTYTYVGAGIWQRTGDANSVDAFAYGVETPSSALPRKGSGQYRVDLLGSIDDSQGSSDLRGTGRVGVDFASAAIGGDGRVEKIGPDGVLDAGDWEFTGQLSSSVDRFSGTINLFQNTSVSMTGSIDGRFYGPQFQEIGAAFSASRGSESRAVGALIGRIRPEFSFGSNETLVDLRFNDSFLADMQTVSYEVDASGEPQSITSIARTRNTFRMTYEVTDSAYGFYRSGQVEAEFGGDQQVASESSDRFVVYQNGSGDSLDRLVLYRPGEQNDLLALSYASFGAFSQVRPSDQPGRNRVQRSWFGYGLMTNGNAIPRTGEGTYDAVIRGTGLTGNASMPLLAMQGTARFEFDFAAGTLGGFMSPIGVESDGTRHDLGRYDFVDGFIQSGLNNWGTLIRGQGQLSAHAALQGHFMGPNAEEIAGQFSGQFIPPGASGPSGQWVGAFAGARCTAC